VIGVSMRDLFEDKNFKASDSFWWPNGVEVPWAFT
jgi:hypothetical protein